MKKLFIALLFLFSIFTYTYSVESNFEGVWYYYFEKLDRDVYLIIKQHDDIYFVVYGTEKSSRMTVGIIKNENLIIPDAYGGETIFKYNEKENRIERHMFVEGMETLTFYTHLDKTKKEGLLRQYFPKYN